MLPTCRERPALSTKRDSMPATAAQNPESDEPRLAPVVPLASRRVAKDTGGDPGILDATEAELAEHARRHWARVFAAAGVDMSSPESAAVVRVVTAELERLVGGLLALREGREGLPADPEAGVDLTSAVEITGVLRDLARMAQAQPKRD